MSHHQKLTTLAVASVLSSLASQVLADTQMAPMVVTATRQEQRISDLLADVSVISREQIESAGQSTLADILAQQPGLQISNNGGPGKATSLFMRGADSSHTLVLVDGMRIGSATVGTPSLEQIPLSQVDHVEILRGPASALYGSDAIGGVVQIFTRRGEGKPVVEAFAGYGSYNTRELSSGISGGNETWSSSLRGAYLETDGLKAIDSAAKQPYSFNPSSSADGFRTASASGALAFRPASGQELGVTFLASQGRNWYEQYGNTEGVVDVGQTVVGFYSRNRLSDAWVSTLRVGETIDDAKDYTYGRVKTRQDQLSWQNDVRIPFGSLLVSLESLNQKAFSEGGFDLSRRINSALLGWTGNFGDHRLQANVRRDDNSQYGGKTTGYGAYGYQLTRELRAQVSLGSAFRAPSFNELYWPGFGNPALKPEDAHNREAGLVWERGAQRIGVTVYDNHVSNLISTVCDANWNCLPENVGNAELKGLTTEYAGKLGHYDVAGSADFLNASDADTGMRLPRRARHQASLRISRPVGGWTIGGEWQGLGDRYDSTTGTNHMGGYGLLNVFTKYAIDRAWSIEARANNLTDKKYETAWGYATPGANVFIGLRYAPK